MNKKNPPTSQHSLVLVVASLVATSTLHNDVQRFDTRVLQSSSVRTTRLDVSLTTMKRPGCWRTLRLRRVSVVCPAVFLRPD